MRKLVKMVYFKATGEVYRIEEEIIVGEVRQDDIVKAANGKVRYKNMDYVVMDGGDGERPKVRPHLIKVRKEGTGFRGLGGN